MTPEASEHYPKCLPARPTAADTGVVLNDFSRRSLLQAGSVLGLLSLVGCASDQTANTEPPDIDWPKPPQGPERVITKTTPPSPPQNNAPPTQPDKQPTQPAQTALPVGVLPRTKWTTATLVNARNARAMNGVNCITIHHDAIRMLSESESESIKRLRSIQSSHVNRTSKIGEGWADIGYHYIVDRAGRVWEGRPIRYQGAHVEDRNEHNIGVMCMGNFQEQSPTKAQTDRLDMFVAELMRTYGIPLRSVRTHQEWAGARTDCPGRSMQSYMTRTRARGGNMALAAARLDPTLMA